MHTSQKVVRILKIQLISHFVLERVCSYRYRKLILHKFMRHMCEYQNLILLFLTKKTITGKNFRNQQIQQVFEVMKLTFLTFHGAWSFLDKTQKFSNKSNCASPRPQNSWTRVLHLQKTPVNLVFFVDTRLFGKLEKTQGN